MKTLKLVQGSPEWAAHRANSNNASDAPAMMGVSKYKTRDQLLKERATGFTADVSPHTQKLFDRGHAAEAAVRPKIEALIGEELYPVTGVSDEYPRLSASFDGIDMAEEIGLEVKLLNADLVAQVKAGELTDAHYYTQIEQQILIGKLKKVVFVTSNEDASEFYHMDYFPVPGRAEAIVAGWAQFEKDLAAYVPEAAPAQVVGAAVASLPSLFVQIVGEVKSSNLVAYKSSALAFIESINTDLQTDQDFADAEKVIKFCDSSEKELETVKKQALSQTASIEELFRTVDDLKASLKAKRLALDKLVSSRKDAIKNEIHAAAMAAIREHVAALNTRFGRDYMPPLNIDVSGAMKGKKTVLSLKGAASDEVARVKIEADRIAKIIDANLATLREKAADHKFLFNDTGTLVLKDPDAVVAIVSMRIAEHAAEQARKAEELAEAAREKIRKEEQQKAEADAQARADEERKQREEDQRKASEATAEAVAAVGLVAAPSSTDPVSRAAEQFGGTGQTVVPTIVEDQVREIAHIPAPAIKPRVKVDTTRPPDAEILDAVTARFSVDKAVAARWLLTMNVAELAKVAA